MVKDICFCDFFICVVFENVFVFIMIFGGFINGVFYFFVMVNMVGVEFIFDDVVCVSDCIFFFVDLVLSGKYFMEDFYKVGGMFFVFKMFVVKGFINGDIMIVIGKIFGENIVDWLFLDFG